MSDESADQTDEFESPGELKPTSKMVSLRYAQLVEDAVEEWWLQHFSGFSPNIAAAKENLKVKLRRVFDEK